MHTFKKLITHWDEGSEVRAADLGKGGSSPGLREAWAVSQVCIPQLGMVCEGIRSAAPVTVWAPADGGMQEDKPFQ